MAPPFSDPRQDIGVLTPDDSDDALLLPESSLQNGYVVHTAKKPVKDRENRDPKGSGGSSAFRFVVVDHPDRLKDKGEMRENRMHVMHDYLDKERRRPASRDPRLNGAIRTTRGRGKLSGQILQRNVNGRADPNTGQLDLSRLTPAESIESDKSSQRTSDRDARRVQDSGRITTKRRAPEPERTGRPNAESTAVARHTYDLTKDKQRLVAGMGGRFEHSTYNKAMIEDIPTKLGAPLEPFGTCEL